MTYPDPTHYRVLCGQSAAGIVADIRDRTGWDFTLEDLYRQNAGLSARAPRACEDLVIALPASPQRSTAAGGSATDDNDTAAYEQARDKAAGSSPQFNSGGGRVYSKEDPYQGDDNAPPAEADAPAQSQDKPDAGQATDPEPQIYILNGDQPCNCI